MNVTVVAPQSAPNSEILFYAKCHDEKRKLVIKAAADSELEQKSVSHHR